MGYITTQEIINKYGTELLARMTTGGNATPDTALIDSVIGEISNQIDGYIGRQIDVPMTSPTPAIKKLCAELVFFSLKQVKNMEWITDNELEIYKANMRTLESYGSGKIKIGTTSTDRVRPTIAFQSKTRIMGRVS